MPLKVANCPVCKAPLVFGEKRCRKCGQTFNYGATAPAEPSFSQIIEALSAAGHEIPMELFGDDPPLPPAGKPVAATAPAARPQPTAARPAARPEPKVPTLEGLDTGRFKSVDVVETEDIPGFIDSSLFAQFTPKEVNVARVSGLETGRSEVGEVRVQKSVEIETTAQDDVGDVRTVNISGIFHSDFLKAPEVPIETGTLEGLDVSPTATRVKPGATDDAAGKRKKKMDGLSRVLCRCGEIHREERCPSCGTMHRDLE